MRLFFSKILFLKIELFYFFSILFFGKDYFIFILSRNVCPHNGGVLIMGVYPYYLGDLCCFLVRNTSSLSVPLYITLYDIYYIIDVIGDHPWQLIYDRLLA